jgi:hypothetical protein
MRQIRGFPPHPHQFLAQKRFGNFYRILVVKFPAQFPTVITSKHDFFLLTRKRSGTTHQEATFKKTAKLMLVLAPMTGAPPSLS